MNIQQSYREATVQGASPVELVIRLYEQMIEDFRKVSQGIEKNDIRLRTDRIRHAILVVGYLQSSLDFAGGGKVAQNLNNFYNTLRESLVKVQFHPTKLGVAQLITDVLTVREAWIQVERAEKAAVTATPRTVSSSVAYPEAESAPVRAEWQG